MLATSVVPKPCAISHCRRLTMAIPVSAPNPVLSNPLRCPAEQFLIEPSRTFGLDELFQIEVGQNTKASSQFVVVFACPVFDGNDHALFRHELGCR